MAIDVVLVISRGGTNVLVGRRHSPATFQLLKLIPPFSQGKEGIPGSYTFLSRAHVRIMKYDHLEYSPYISSKIQ